MRGPQAVTDKNVDMLTAYECGYANRVYIIGFFPGKANLLDV